MKTWLNIMLRTLTIQKNKSQIDGPEKTTTQNKLYYYGSPTSYKCVSPTTTYLSSLQVLWEDTKPRKSSRKELSKAKTIPCATKLTMKWKWTTGFLFDSENAISVLKSWFVTLHGTHILYIHTHKHKHTQSYSNYSLDLIILFKFFCFLLFKNFGSSPSLL